MSRFEGWRSLTTCPPIRISPELIDSSPMTVALYNIVNTSTGVIEYNVNMAAAIIAAAPTLVVYILAGRYFVRDLMAGAVKG